MTIGALQKQLQKADNKTRNGKGQFYDPECSFFHGNTLQVKVDRMTAFNRRVTYLYYVID